MSRRADPQGRGGVSEERERGKGRANLAVSPRALGERESHTHTQKKRIARTGRGAPRAYFTSKGLLELKRRHEVVRDRDKTGATL